MLAGRVEEARALLEEADRQAPSLALPQVLLAQIFLVQLLGRREGKTPDWLEVFAAGREEYTRREWARAEKLFQKVLRLKPEDVPARVFLERCRRFQQQPPPDEWEGVFVLESK
ncbi:MAG: hypothetical protein FJ134_10435 [Deltaproteobacteria bacterium]|nr:hypothetical protein [Deltaproteobacteria bacterium]